MTVNWKLESDVNDWVKRQLEGLGLVKLVDFNEESAMSPKLKSALKGAAKTKMKTKTGTPDFHVEKYVDRYKVPVIIEDKLKLNKLVAQTKDGLKFDYNSVNSFAVNGAIHYSRKVIDSGKYNEVIAIGIAGDNAENVAIKVYYVFGSAENAHKEVTTVTTLDFLENEKTFAEFYNEAKLSEEDKHQILIDSQATLQHYAKKLNKLMHNHNITAPQRVLYVSGMLLAMQEVVDSDGKHVDDGLTPDDLKGIQSASKLDGKKVVDQIKSFLDERNINPEKLKLMMASFAEISKDSQRDELHETDKEVAKFIDGSSSVTKQIFTFIFEYIFKSIDGLGGHIDIMGEMYSEFLKYALGDGKEIGIVLTPPYVTKMMSQILDIDMNNKVMDLATGSAGFLISAMELMVDSTNEKYGKRTSKAEKTIRNIKRNNLLGIELNAEMYTLATTNMILRGDGSSRIEKGSAFNRPESLFADFKADRVLLNPPFSYKENGLPFIAYGLDKMEKGGLGAIIIQDSAGSGKATETAKAILKKHTLLASIKMPVDLFVPMAGVQTSIYIFEAHKKHDYEQTVKFIDFRNDGYKRAKRGISEIDSPVQRYQDIIKIYKAGTRAKVDQELWNLEQVYFEDFITDKGNDWNFEQHQVIDTKPTLDDFKKTVADYLAWEVEQLLKSKGEDSSKKS